MRGHGVACLNALSGSVYQQTFRDYAMVISDDSSGDDIRRYVDTLLHAFRKAICYTKNPGAKTILFNLNHALLHASGELVK
jgi:glycosyltransferase involved in cell wall biosynthesis